MRRRNGGRYLTLVRLKAERAVAKAVENLGRT